MVVARGLDHHTTDGVGLGQKRQEATMPVDRVGYRHLLDGVVEHPDGQDQLSSADVDAGGADSDFLGIHASSNM